MQRTTRNSTGSRTSFGSPQGVEMQVGVGGNDRRAKRTAIAALDALGNVSSPERRQRPKKHVTLNLPPVPLNAPLAAQIDHVQQQLELAEQQGANIAGLEDQVQELQEELYLGGNDGEDDQGAALQNQLTALQNQLDEAQAFQAMVPQLQQQITTLQQQHRDAQIQILQTPRTQLRTQLPTLKAQQLELLTRLNQRPENGDISTALKRGNLRMIAADIETLEADFQELQAALPEPGAAPEELLQKLNEQQLRFARLQPKFQTIQTQLQRLNREIENIAPQHRRTWAEIATNTAMVVVPALITGAVLLIQENMRYNAPLGGFGT